jgi:hypothetical protein
MDETYYTPAETLAVGRTVVEDDGFLLAVAAVEMLPRVMLLTLVPVYGSVTWPGGEERQVKVGRRRMVRVA